MAWDVLVFIVHELNPVNHISLDQVREIYFGRVKNWKQLGGLDMGIKTFLSRLAKGLSGVEASINKMVLNGKEPAK